MTPQFTMLNYNATPARAPPLQYAPSTGRNLSKQSARWEKSPARELQSSIKRCEFKKTASGIDPKPSGKGRGEDLSSKDPVSARRPALLQPPWRKIP
jgi:hypothetical protein